MKSKNLILFACLLGLLATGCSTPFQVKQLARETQRATDHMATVHESDLRSLSSYDQNRVAQFDRLLGDYLALREDMVRAFNDALEWTKKATLAELDHDFDKRANKLLTVDFWLAFREEANRDLNQILLKDREQAIARIADADAHPRDIEAVNRSLLATRKAYAGAAIKFDAVEKNFAELARIISRERDAYRVANEKRLAAITAFTLPGNVNSFTLTSNADEINTRIAELKHAYQTLRDSQSKLSQYLDEYNPSADFFKGVLDAFVDTKLVADNTGITPLSADPTEPTGGKLPGLGGLLSGVQEIVGKISVAKTEGLDALAPALGKIMAEFRPVIKAEVPEPAANNAGVKVK